MNIRAAVERLIHLRNAGPLVRFVLLPLTLCSFIYCLAMRVRAWSYRAGLLRSYSLPCRVIGVGNITVGGTGKTPTVCLLARTLLQRGLSVAVVCRGYLGSKTMVPQVVSDGVQVLATCSDAGDEAVLLARKLSGIPVIACRDRVAGGRLACERFASQVVLLDDGFQHLRLRRDLDIVLVDAGDPFGNGRLLPRGILREPLAALRRAGLIVLTKADESDAAAALASRIHRVHPSARLFSASYAVACLRNVLSGEQIRASELAGKTVAALCSIGQPGSFLGMLQRLGTTVAEPLVFPDHHAYGLPDYQTIRAAASRVDFIMTTEKDIAKLDIGMLQIENLIVMEIEQVIEPDERFFEDVIRLSGL